MALSIKCPHCGRVLKAGEGTAGKRVNCPACKKLFLAPKAPSQAKSPSKPRPKPPPPVGAAPRTWHLHVDGRNLGPYTVGNIIDQLQTGKIDADTLAWHEGMADWKPLGKIKEFRGALTTPPPVRKVGAQDKDHERHQRYSPAKGKRDVVLGTWIAVGLAVILLVAILIIVNRPPPEAGPPPEPKVTVRYEQPPELPGKLVFRGPRPDHVPRKTTVRQESNEKVLANLVTELDGAFKAAIAAHKKGVKPAIFKLGRTCKTYAEKIGSRDWGAYKSQVETLVLRLNQAGDGIEKEMKDESKHSWDMPDIGLDEKARVKQLDLDKVEWLENWQKNLNEDVERIRKKGLSF